MAEADPLSAGRTALVTGAASGIGRAVCLALARRGMNVCLVDLPGAALDEATHEVAAAAPGGAKVVAAMAADVGDASQVAAMREQAVERFGAVHLLMNNAVTRAGRGFDADPAEWRQAFEVNFWGVDEAVRAFLPGMAASGGRAMIVNTGSKQGITNPPGHPVYNIAKSALKTYTEALEHELRSNPAYGGRISAHLLIPGWTTTAGRAHKPGAWLPEQVAEFLLAGLARGDFYILCPDDETTTETDHRRILWGAGDITENRPALSRWHPDFAAAAKKAGC